MNRRRARHTAPRSSRSRNRHDGVYERVRILHARQRILRHRYRILPRRRGENRQSRVLDKPSRPRVRRRRHDHHTPRATPRATKHQFFTRPRLARTVSYAPRRAFFPPTSRRVGAYSQPTDQPHHARPRRVSRPRRARDAAPRARDRRPIARSTPSARTDHAPHRVVGGSIEIIANHRPRRSQRRHGIDRRDSESSWRTQWFFLKLKSAVPRRDASK